MSRNGVRVGLVAVAALGALSSAASPPGGATPVGTASAQKAPSPLVTGSLQSIGSVQRPGQPPSCAGLSRTCGASGSADCCASLQVPGGTFDITTTPLYRANVSTFRLDKFEVTVGRFRKFVAAWDGGWRPAESAGKHRHLNGGKGLALLSGQGGFESGWSSEWNGFLATTPSGWDTNLKSKPGEARQQIQVWTPSPGPSETQPISHVTFYEAYAFCAWDGGFLPSEAEWLYASAAGSEKRPYPWGSDMPSTGNSYYCESETCSATNVGSKSPQGDGKWGQSDLAGNVIEWTQDGYGGFPQNRTCTDCMVLGDFSRREMRSACNLTSPSNLNNDCRPSNPPDARSYSVGFRCARP